MNAIVRLCLRDDSCNHLCLRHGHLSQHKRLCLRRLILRRRQRLRRRGRRASCRLWSASVSPSSSPITIIIIAVTEGRQTDRKAVAVSQETSSAAERTARPVCLSHAGILSKRLNILSHFFSPVGLPHHSNFPYQTSCQYSDGDPLTGELNAGGTKKQFGTNNLFYC